jgi:hypothetical protein
MKPIGDIPSAKDKHTCRSAADVALNQRMLDLERISISARS